MIVNVISISSELFIIIFGLSFSSIIMKLVDEDYWIMFSVIINDPIIC